MWVQWSCVHGFLFLHWFFNVHRTAFTSKCCLEAFIFEEEACGRPAGGSWLACAWFLVSLHQSWLEEWDCTQVPARWSGIPNLIGLRGGTWLQLSQSESLSNPVILWNVSGSGGHGGERPWRFGDLGSPDAVLTRGEPVWVRGKQCGVLWKKVFSSQNQGGNKIKH